MSDKPITRLILDFPHGASVKDCDFIAQKAQSVVMAGVSEGGFATTNKYGMYVDDMKFSEDTMHYTYGHSRDKETPSDKDLV